MFDNIAKLLTTNLLNSIHDATFDELKSRSEIVEIDGDDFDLLPPSIVYNVGQKAFANLQKRGAIATWFVAHKPDSGLLSEGSEGSD